MLRRTREDRYIFFFHLLHLRATDVAELPPPASNPCSRDAPLSAELAVVGQRGIF